jgi:basic amino acid/polyamine antiporter, APA family
MPTDLPRRIGFWGASAIMVGVIIGSGIFRQPPEIAKHLGSPLVILILWAVGGILSLCGALTYAELSTMYPRSGGVYVFLREGLGRPIAFVFGWTYMLITKPFAAAGIAVIFSEHLLLLCGIQIDDPGRRAIVINSITTAALVLLTIINTVGVGPGAALAKVLTALKFGALAAIVALAVILMKGSAANFAPVEPLNLTDITQLWPFLAALAPVMLAILWTYDGWSDVGSIAGEIKDPQRQLPRIYLIGTAAVTALYLAINAVYFWLVPLTEMRTLTTVAPTVMDRLIGVWGGIAVTAIIMVSTLGASHSAVLTGARITFAQARDGLLFRSLGHIHPRFQTPDCSLVVQLVMSVAALWYAGSFKNLADGFTFTMWIFYGLAACSIFVLRIRLPDAPRPFRCPGYPFIPALFIAAAAGMTILTIAGDISGESKGWQTLPWLAVLAAGFPVYWVWKLIVPTGSDADATINHSG